MSSEIDSDLCELCTVEQARTLPSSFDGVHQNCPRCGEFKISGTAGAVLLGEVGKKERAKLSGWVRDQNRVGSVPFITSDNLNSLLARSLPSVADRALGLLLEAERGLANLGDRFNLNDPRFLAATYSSDPTDVAYLLSVLQDQGLAEAKVMGGGCEILPGGYVRLDQLRRQPAASSYGFVAMWFHNDLTQVYAEGFEAGVLRAGYEPIRMDRIEHINKIDDEIIRQINASRFLVADFTGHRGGVYFEAGYAVGLGMPVFWTCRKDHLSDLHFDIRQFNCIDWEAPEDLAHRLSTRLEAVLGPGPKKA